MGHFPVTCSRTRVRAAPVVAEPACDLVGVPEGRVRIGR